MRAAAFVGRVGELAVALGVGAALFTGTGTAWADPSAESSDAAPAAATPSDSADVAATGPTTGSSPNTATSSAATSAATDGPTSTVSASTVTVTADDADEDEPEEEATDEPVAKPKVKKPSAKTTESTSAPVSTVSANETRANAEDPEPQTDSSPLQRTAASTAVAVPRSPEPVVPSLRPWPTAFDPITAVTYVTGLVSSVVSAILSPFAAGAPALPSDPTPWALLAWVRRELFNESPTVTARPQTQSLLDGDVVVRGNVGAADGDGDATTYTVVGRPLNGGTVTVAANGDFTYRPMNAMAAVGGTDQFTVVVSDEAAGSPSARPDGAVAVRADPRKLPRSGGGHRVATTITVTVTPVDGVDLSLPAEFDWGVAHAGSRPKAAPARRSTPTPTGTGGCTIPSTSCSA